MSYHALRRAGSNVRNHPDLQFRSNLQAASEVAGP